MNSRECRTQFGRTEREARQMMCKRLVEVGLHESLVDWEPRELRA